MICHFHGVLDDRECPKTQKIHLEQAQLLDRSHGELGRGRAVLGARQRYEILSRLRTYDDARRMDGGVPGQALQAQTHVDQLVDPLVALVGFSQIRALFEGFLQGDAQLLRDHF